ncbi:GSCOCG00002210001-RA-CDS [Cotesia congregata]|uniref:Similar to jarid2b: Protein Jumonji (Danio rerio) n=1 Tax=Cotesia congregata TaxID=51543 RepID=A0A8J2HKB2_COTCN|nr:GSCOCG00002210001-RA-CDS [Cotesia congregata]CAG5103939.1 Similar to jarid2b: Protein Jumonji (Danio rerio) [Cotesia congregata]
MVLSRNDKRKRKVGDLVDLMDPLSESPKRAKVHAQRKFAQGAATVFTSPQTLVKEKEKPKPSKVTELITHKRPNTEDFLTFLCFRGTSILPPSLDFFNAGSKKDKPESKTTSKKLNSTSNSTFSPTPSTSGVGSKAVTNQSPAKTTGATKVTEPTRKKVATEIPKPINKYKSATSTIQALKKKYQEQRLAKQRIENKLKKTCVIRTRSTVGRPMLKTVHKLAPRKFLRVEPKRHCLRSNTTLEKPFKAFGKTKMIIASKGTAKKRAVVKEPSSESSSSESSSEDNKSDVKLTQQIKRTIKSIKKNATNKPESRRVTRSCREVTTTAASVAHQQSSTQRPSRKTKEAAAVYMEILSRKLVSPDLDNDDNLSVDSYPELPNTRRLVETEAKVKVKKLVKEKDKGKDKDKEKDKIKDKKEVTSSKSNPGGDKGKEKAAKNKKAAKVQEISESEEESVSSEESTRARRMTRRSSSSVPTVKPVTRSLRSSSRNSPQKIDSPVVLAKKNKTWVRRKREVTGSPVEKVKEKEKEKKPNEKKSKEEKEEDSSVSKVKKKKEDKDEKIEKDNKVVKKDIGKEKVEKDIKGSDDEESFRGFTSKPITKLINSRNSLSVNLIASEEVNKKLSALKSTVASETREKVGKTEGSLVVDGEVKSEQKESLSSHVPVVGSLSSQASISEPDKKLNRVESLNPPVVAPVIDIPLITSSPLGRKERVNMSTEQIEKWLNESSMAKEESKAEMETVSNFTYEVPKSKNDMNHLSIPSRIQHLVRPVNVAIAKMAERSLTQERLNNAVRAATLVNAGTIIGAGIVNLSTPVSLVPTTNRNKINADIKEIIKGRIVKTTTTATACSLNKDTVCEDSDVSSRADGTTSVEGSPEKKSPDKKSVVRKTFLPKVKERKTAIPSINAFSPENESSVYAFESDTEAPINTPFRRKQRDSKSGASGSSDLDVSRTESEDGNARASGKSTEKEDKCGSKSKSVGTSSEDVEAKSFLSGDKIKEPSGSYQIPGTFRNMSNVQVVPLGKIPSVWNNVNCSASIAVQVNFDDQSQDLQTQGTEESQMIQRSTEISTQTENTNENEDENDAHVFYIPLQTVARSGPNLAQGQPLIQGVAVKLGTEGPTGPNQRVLLRAQLVTKPPMAVARCPPVGTVQPTTRTPPTDIDPVASTSKSTSTSTSTSNLSPIKPNEAQEVAKLTEKIPKSPKATRERKSSADAPKVARKLSAKAKKNAEMADKLKFFPKMEEKGEARLVDAPTFYPSEKDFQDPLEYIDKIRPIAEKYGICRVVPPSNFKPECKVSDDMRFTAYNQYIHRMLHRWGPNVKEMMAIKKYLATQSITLNQPPWIGGMEVDLPHLYQTVQSLGGLKEVIEKKKWQKVADGMKIPKSAQDRVTKLDDIYCKYLLPYDTLSTDEREKLFDQVEAEWRKRESKALQRLNSTLSSDNDDDEDEDSSDETEECIVKGRNMPLNAFYRIARNTQRMWFSENQSGIEADGASACEVEAAFWKHVSERKRHVCVHSASIDSSGRGFGFSVAKNSPFARHPWNLKVLTNNNGSVLRALGPLMGVTVPTLHVGMLFSACCWYRDPHGLPWIEYLHTGAKKIWYGIPDEHSNNFREALSKMVPRFCKNKTIWLPSDTAMVPPEMLVSNGVPLCKTVQEPGQFIVVFPKAFTSSICTGYVVSESVYFAQTTWLEHAEQIFKDLQDSCEPSMFSFERLLFSIINDTRSHVDVLKQILPVVTKIRDRELNYRQQLEYYGLNNKEKLPLPGSGKRKKGQKFSEDEDDYECENCRATLFVSLVNNSQDDSVYCLPHGLQLIGRKKQVLKHCTLKYTYSEDELDELIHKLEDKIEAKSKRTNQTRQARL